MYMYNLRRVSVSTVVHFAVLPSVQIIRKNYNFEVILHIYAIIFSLELSLNSEIFTARFKDDLR